MLSKKSLNRVAGCVSLAAIALISVGCTVPDGTSAPTAADGVLKVTGLVFYADSPASVAGSAELCTAVISPAQQDKKFCSDAQIPSICASQNPYTDPISWLIANNGQLPCAGLSAYWSDQDSCNGFYSIRLGCPGYTDPYGGSVPASYGYICTSVLTQCPLPKSDPPAPSTAASQCQWYSDSQASCDGGKFAYHCTVPNPDATPVNALGSQEVCVGNVHIENGSFTTELAVDQGTEAQFTPSATQKVYLKIQGKAYPGSLVDDQGGLKFSFELPTGVLGN